MHSHGSVDSLGMGPSLSGDLMCGKGVISDHWGKDRISEGK